MKFFKFFLRYVVIKKEKKQTVSNTVAPGLFLAGKVRYVWDGDCVSVVCTTGELCIRLSAIDCPEDGQEWGNVATAGLVKMIGGKEVFLEVYGLDNFGRTLATVYYHNGQELVNVNERMVMLGHAWVMRRYYQHLSFGRQNRLNELERWAKTKRVGLWKMDSPVPPWEWRGKNKKVG